MEADQRTTEMEKRLMDVVAPLVADREPAVLRKPGQCALHHPPVPTQLAAALYALSCYAALYPALSQGSFAFSIVVGFVGMQLLGTLPRPSPTGTLDWLYGVDELLEDHRVVDVCCAEHYRQRDAPSVRNKVALGALLSFIRRIRCGFWAPLLAGMEAESSEARSHSIWSASPRRSRRTRCSLSHTPASCHSRKRRQQVMPDPHAISWGSISQGIPLFSTKTIPVRAARSSMRGLPPWGFGGSGGRSGSMVSHNSSVTSSLAMFSCYPLNGFVRLIKPLEDQRVEEGDSLLGRNVESYTQQMKYQDDQPSNYPTDRADEHGEQVDGSVVCKNQVRQEQENHSDDPIDDEPPQIAPASCE